MAMLIEGSLQPSVRTNARSSPWSSTMATAAPFSRRSSSLLIVCRTTTASEWLSVGVLFKKTSLGMVTLPVGGPRLHHEA